MTEILPLIAYAVVGIIAGFLSGLLGIGGGLITVPCLTLIFHFIGFPQAYLIHTAIGTSLAAMILTSLAASWAHERRKGIMWDILLYLFPGILLGSLLGALIAHFLSGIILEIFFGVSACVIGVFFLRTTSKEHPSHQKPKKTTFTWLGLFIGTLASLLGIGGGIITSPLLMSCGYEEKKAIGTSAASGFIISVLGAIAYLYYGLNQVNLANSFGYIYLPAFIVLSIFTVLTAPFGAAMAHRLPGNKLRKVFGAVMVLVGILMIFN